LKKKEYVNLSSQQLKALIRKKEKEISILDDYCFEVKQKEDEEKYITVKVKGCKGCELENSMWNNTCDHCGGYHDVRRQK
jgi:hypothetical protein